MQMYKGNVDIGQVAETAEKEGKPQLSLVKGGKTAYEGTSKEGSTTYEDTINGKRHLGPAHYQSRRIRQEWGCEESGFDWDKLKNGAEVHMHPLHKEGPKIADNYFSFGFNTPIY